MAETSAALKTLRDSLITFLTGKMAAADVASFQLGAQSVTTYSLADLWAFYNGLCARIEALDGGTEYVDHFDDGTAWTGHDGTVSVGDDEA